MTAILTEEIDPPSSLAVGGLPCHTVDPETFFADAPPAIEYAKALCADCPIVAECLEGAKERREAAGVWGGQLFQNGVIIARKRPRGRPRKNPQPTTAPATPVAPAARKASAPSERAGHAPLAASRAA